MHKFVVVTLIGVAALFSAKLAGQDSSGTIYRRPLPATWTVRSSQPAQMNAIALKNAGGAPSPPTNTWTFIQEGYWSNFGAQSGSGGSNCGSPLCRYVILHSQSPTAYYNWKSFSGASALLFRRYYYPYGY